MKDLRFIMSAVLLASCLFISSCTVVGDIFKAGVGVGIFVVVAVIVVIIIIIGMAMKK